MVSNSHPQSFEASDLPTKHVTVYADRAEVNKTINVHLKQGHNEILITKLSRSLDQDSIRVEGYGKASITEVKYQERNVVKDEEVKEKEKELHQKIKKLKDERQRIEQNLERSKRQKEVLDGIANQLGRGTVCSEKEEGTRPSAYALISDGDGLDNLEKFLDYYVKRHSDLDGKLNDLRQQYDKIDEEINVSNSQLSENYGACCAHVKEVTVFVSCTEESDGTLDIFYVVRNASWKPSYDVRVQTQEPSMKLFLFNFKLKLTYYGLIEQDTDEDWKDTKLTLSTAAPRIGGQVPELGTTKVSFYKPPQIQPRMMATTAESFSVNECSFGASAPQEQLRVARYDAPAPPRMKSIEAIVKENVTSTVFEIENKTTVPSDSSLHKVTVAVVDLKPTFEYESIPSKSTFAYFKAKTVNTSHFPFLAGPTAIFVNQSFVANGSMKAVNTSEDFNVSLGVDPSIKVEYKAAKKFNEESGILTKSSLLTQEQKIGLHNTKNEAIRLIVVEPFPQSTEEKLKVSRKLLEGSTKLKSLSIRKLCQNVNATRQLGLGIISTLSSPNLRSNRVAFLFEIILSAILDPFNATGPWLQSLGTDLQMGEQVTLLEPALNNKADKHVHVVLNKQNNVEWQLNLQPNEKKELILKYQIEHPKGEQIEHKEE
uniref:Protein F37C4.5 n=1 Tax=Romanomermis culicivorax TaxID=13658 RepID=A0A915KWP3_ROMCU